MSKTNTNTAKSAFLATIPVLLGYSAIGIAFGLLVVASGFPWWVVLIMSVFVYAGAGQFIGVGILTAGGGIAEIALVTLLVNARHMVYGLSMHERFRGTHPFKPYLVFALTDETYGLLTTLPPPAENEKKYYYFFIALLNHCYWASAGMIGYFLGRVIPINTEGLGYALTALFVVLLIEQIKTCRKFLPFAIACSASIGSLLLFGKENMLIMAIAVSIVLLLGFRKRITDGSDG